MTTISPAEKELAEKGYTLPEYHFAAHLSSSKTEVSEELNYSGAESAASGVMEVRGWAELIPPSLLSGSLFRDIFTYFTHFYSNLKIMCYTLKKMISDP